MVEFSSYHISSRAKRAAKNWNGYKLVLGRYNEPVLAHTFYFCLPSLLPFCVCVCVCFFFFGGGAKMHFLDWGTAPPPLPAPLNSFLHFVGENHGQKSSWNDPLVLVLQLQPAAFSDNWQQGGETVDRGSLTAADCVPLEVRNPPRLFWGAFHKAFCQWFSPTNVKSYWNPCIWLAKSKFVGENHWQNALWNAPRRPPHHSQAVLALGQQSGAK